MRRFGVLGGLALLFSVTVHALTNPSPLIVIAPTVSCCSAGGLLPVPGAYYGRTYSGSGSLPYGSIFRTDLSGDIVTLHAFTGNAADDGAYPNSLIRGSDGLVYGTTYGGGGASGRGTVFSMDADGAVTTLHRFSGPDGDRPRAGLMQASDGSFYGTTDLGGSAGQGTIFKIDTSGVLTTIHHFTGVDGRRPFVTLTETSDGALYGTTFEGGAGGRGTIFRLEATGTITTVHNFAGVDGDGPYNLIQASDGLLYGVTRFGGLSDRGTVFSIPPGGSLTTLHSLNAVEGREPVDQLLEASDGRFYGITLSGGGKGIFGTAFSIDAAGDFRTVHRFATASGHAAPAGSFVETPDHRLLGTEMLGSTVYALSVVDLHVTEVSSTTASAAPGGSVDVTDTVVNDELSTADGSTTRYFLSFDRAKSADDRRLLGGRAVDALVRNASSTGVATLNVPSTMPAGTYYVIACADDRFEVGETIETNNCAASEGTVLIDLPDLITTAVVAPPNAVIGHKMTLVNTVANLGNATAVASKSRFYLSFDPVRDGGDTLLSAVGTVPALAPAAASEKSQLLSVPRATPPGAYFVLACADDVAKIPETDESNNCRASDGTVAVGP